MTDQELETLLRERVTTFDLKQEAFNSLQNIFTNYSNDKGFLDSYTQDEIKPIFERFEYHIDRRNNSPIIRTRIRLYIEDSDNNIEPIGYYDLDTDLSGKFLDDWLIIDEERHLKEVNVISHFQNINQFLPADYLRRNHIQYEFVTYISLAGTLFISKEFEGAGRFIKRAYTYLETIDNTKFDTSYLKSSKYFLKLLCKYLTTNNLITEGLKQELSIIK